MRDKYVCGTKMTYFLQKHSEVELADNSVIWISKIRDKIDFNLLYQALIDPILLSLVRDRRSSDRYVSVMMK